MTSTYEYVSTWILDTVDEMQVYPESMVYTIIMQLCAPLGCISVQSNGDKRREEVGSIK